MPIPGVPTIQPVELPRMSPQQAGKPGLAIADMGEDIQGMAAIESHLREAQGVVDEVAAGNQLHETAMQFKIQLDKTQNSRDVPEVLQQGRNALNEIAKDWSKSPSAVKIQMYADSLNPQMEYEGANRTGKLQTDELDLQLAQSATNLATPYAQARAVGDKAGEDAAVGAFVSQVMGGVSTGIYGPAQAADKVRKFREAGQELQIRNAISNPDPKVNKAIYDQLNSNPGAFPDVIPEHVDAFKGQADDAVEKHIKHQAWAEGQMAEKTMLPDTVNKWTNPATRILDEGKALSDTDSQFAAGKISAVQRDAIVGGLRAIASDQYIALKKDADKRLDDIEKDLSGTHPNFAAGTQKLEASKDWFEQNGFGEDYRASLTKMRQAQTEVRTEARYQRSENREEVMLERQQAADQSTATLNDVMSRFSQGYVATDTDLNLMAGTGPGKLSTKDLATAQRFSKQYQKDSGFKDAADFIEYSLSMGGLPKGATDAQKEEFNKAFPRQAMMQAETKKTLMEERNKHPDKNPMEIASEVLKPAVQQQIAARVNQLFGTQPEPSKMDYLKAGVRSLFGMVPSVPNAAPTAGPKDGDTKKNSAGADVVYRNGKWGYK